MLESGFNWPAFPTDCATTALTSLEVMWTSGFEDSEENAVGFAWEMPA